MKKINKQTKNLKIIKGNFLEKQSKKKNNKKKRDKIKITHSIIFGLPIIPPPYHLNSFLPFYSFSINVKYKKKKY